MKASLLALTLLAAGAFPAFGQVSLTSVGQNVYTQNFDSLTTSTTSTAWANNSTLTGWSLFTKDGAAITNYYGGTGSTNTGAFYSFGTNSDRALGGLASGGTYFGSPASGNLAGWIALALTNTTGSTLTSATIKFDGEQWRNGGNTSAQAMVLQYGFGSSFTNVSNWTTPGGSFNWTSPVVSASGTTSVTLDGNAAANRVADVGGMLSNLSWNDGDTLWFRWIENNDAGSDHALAIDNLSVSVIPEPSTYALFAGLAVLGFAAKRRRA